MNKLIEQALSVHFLQWILVCVELVFVFVIDINNIMLDEYSMQCYKASMLLLGVMWKS